jgi:glycosyltransferase involved in cell wall biosynthesis
MNIAIFDYKVIPNNPTGGCNLRMLKGISRDHKVTVFSVEFENPDPDRIYWVRIPSPTRPLVLLFAVYFLLAPLYYWVHCLRTKVHFDSVLIVESNLSFGDISYAHFCHRAYLKKHWGKTGSSGLRRGLRWIFHKFQASVEPWSFHHVQHIVVPSQGLARELEQEYPYSKDKIHVFPNPVDTQRMRPPEPHEREHFRQKFGMCSEDLVLVFVALGDFERKGLPLILEALASLNLPQIKLFIVGGEDDLVSTYQSRVKKMGLEEKVIFTGMQKDVRPYLWAADVFILPSSYEVFPLVVLEAAAARLLLVVTALNGVEEFLRDGENGILVERTSMGIAQGIRKVLTMSPTERQRMQKSVVDDVQSYSSENFVTVWSKFFEGGF